VRTEEAARPAASAEDLLAALVFAVVSLLLVATLPSERGGSTAGNGDAAAASRSAVRP
jgi:hypothetical protein